MNPRLGFTNSGLRHRVMQYLRSTCKVRYTSKFLFFIVKCGDYSAGNLECITRKIVYKNIIISITTVLYIYMGKSIVFFCFHYSFHLLSYETFILDGIAIAFMSCLKLSVYWLCLLSRKDLKLQVQKLVLLSAL